MVYNRLPALEVLDSMHIRAASLGFAFLTLTIALGFLWLELTFGRIFFDWKIISALITWTIFGLVLVSKHFFGWSGKRIA
ncbi:MAG: inner membrane protein YpjD, partial [candidate division Zixibacteria bacterium]|nr:inner membrane protein YpjD [Gammaproteobacteria bacterium]NIR65804.1 inner membrane protein YpjD [candidate division Zixibacteria bacterium]NIT74646.1 inner membrane protein YpjD [candidate division KSB1 bacterium]NIS47464.1 inner membrane protein YpjD [candidate division Zixibacteria bacterium]NIV07698.1 inner membrane protein YpjD [candidate division Zixibacteria bacterium]